MADIQEMLAGKRVLAVDDLVESRSAMKKMLVILGAGDVDVAKDGDEATNYILNNDYDIVISDYNLGKGRDGQQILEEARFTHRLKAAATFVMLTGENAMDMVMGAVEYEPDDYVTKPFTIDVMRQRLTRILTIKESLKPINEAIDGRNLEKSLEICDLYIAKQPRLKLRTLRIKGRVLMRLKRFEDALELYSSVLNERDINWALLGKATCLFNLEQFDEAESILNYTIKLHPQYVQCYDLLSKIHVKHKKLTEAQEDLMRAVQVSPKQVLRQMELGRLAFANKDSIVAEKAFKQSMHLARHSCYRSAKNYLLYAKAVQHKVSTTNNRDSRDGSKDAFKALDEVKALYKDNNDYVFEATILEGATFTNLGKEEDAKACAKKAADLLDHVLQPSGVQQLSMVQLYLDTKQHAKAQDLLAEIEKRDDLNKSEARELKKSQDQISEKVVREYTTEINDRAIEYFERGQLTQAIELFDKATVYKEAGLAVLLNAIQTKITYMDQRAPSREMVNSVNDLLERVGSIPASDERYSRWQQLIKNQQRLIRSL